LNSINRKENLSKANSTKVAKKTSSDSLIDIIIDSIQDIKGQNILKLDLKKIGEAPADYFIICEGESTTQVRAISNNIVRRVKEELGLSPISFEGKEYSKWVLVDFFDTVIHVFYPETRKFYELEELWSDAEATHYENL